MPTKKQGWNVPYNIRYKNYLKHRISDFDSSDDTGLDIDVNNPKRFIQTHPLYLNRNTRGDEPFMAKMYGIKDSDRIRTTDSYNLYKNLDKGYRLVSNYPDHNHWIDTYLRLYTNTPMFSSPSNRNKLSLYDYIGNNSMGPVDIYKGYDKEGEYMGYRGLANPPKHYEQYARPLYLSDKKYLSDYFGLPNRIGGRWLPEVIVRGSKSRKRKK